ncbi:MAG: twin-arginine translocation signal domain-containing protein [Thermoflexales bacterium]|nr:twin-arginine translocation signal domain-containing protein [Thermoflexales bacterium]MDW8291610.1 twin-arginine translocation signal domain-containing protein [Anaerolineae bacterium]
MKRRTFLKAAATSAAATATLAFPNVIIAQRNVQWDMATS